ncbi:MAG: hypothetical protein ACPLVI_00240 [Thermoplasmata archaeon]
MKRIAIFLAMIIIIFSLFPFSQARGLTVDIYGPATVGTNGTYEYTIVINGYFDGYGYHLFLTGSNMSGGTTEELTGLSYTTNTFKVNITFPSRPETVYIYVMGIGIVNGSPEKTTSINYIQVNVVKSVPITLTLKNTEPYEIKNISISFFLNGRFIGTSNVSSMGPNSTVNVTYNYIGTFENGVNVLSARLNTNLVKFSSGSNCTTLYFYYGTPPNYDWLWYLLAGITLFTLAIIYFYSSGKKRPGAPKWKK